MSCKLSWKIIVLCLASCVGEDTLLSTVCVAVTAGVGQEAGGGGRGRPGGRSRGRGQSSGRGATEDPLLPRDEGL